MTTLMADDLERNDNEDDDNFPDDVVADGAKTGGKMEVVGRLLMVLLTLLLVMTVVASDAAKYGQYSCWVSSL